MTTTPNATPVIGPKIVKRYANRKLYDTELSKYVTLKQLVEFENAGREVQVVDHTTKADITGQTLLQAIVETEKDLTAETETLRSIIKAGGISKFVLNLLDGKKTTIG